MFSVSCFCIFLNILEIYSFLQYRYLNLFLLRNDDVMISAWREDHEEEYREENRSESPISNQAILSDGIQLICLTKIVKMIRRKSI